MNSWHGTTILSVRKGDKVAIAADGQVSFGNNVIKSTANKIRSINKDSVFAGFAGSTADALTLFERLENKIVQYQQTLDRACVELAKDWRMDRYLRRLEAMLIVVDSERTFILSGSGDVLEPEDGVAAIGSGGNYALAAAKALMDTEYTAEEIVRRAMKIAGDICVFTNHHLTLKVLDSKVAINL